VLNAKQWIEKNNVFYMLGGRQIFLPPLCHTWLFPLIPQMQPYACTRQKKDEGNP
jgi:hypothetical protein